MTLCRSIPTTSTRRRRQFAPPLKWSRRKRNCAYGACGRVSRNTTFIAGRELSSRNSANCAWTLQTKARKNSGRVLLPGNEEHLVSRTANPIVVEQFMNAVKQSPAAALLLDYDGPLAPFCLHRQQALPYPGMTALLQEIIADGRTRVVIITGRNAREIIPL